MAKKMKALAGFFLLLTLVLFALWHSHGGESLLTAVLTSATTAYHFLMRLAVGVVVNAVMQNHADYTKWWYQPRRFEEKLYRKLRVKSWKKYLPTYDPSSFSVAEKSFEDILQAGCQAEVVHEIIIMLSFMPLLIAEKAGGFSAFLLTSCAAALFDSLFVILQRYNRPRLVGIVEKKNRKEKSRT